MTNRQYLRRVAILCCHCLRNLAFHRAGWKGKRKTFTGQFWTNANSNFLDICVLEWCKLFGDHRSKHYWRKAVSNPDVFFREQLRAAGITEDELTDHIKAMRTYRDRFVAHLDTDEGMQIPDLTVTLKTVSFLYDYILENEGHPEFFSDAIGSASTFYNRFLEEGERAYRHERAT